MKVQVKKERLRENTEVPCQLIVSLIFSRPC